MKIMMDPESMKIVGADAGESTDVRPLYDTRDTGPLMLTVSEHSLTRHVLTARLSEQVLPMIVGADLGPPDGRMRRKVAAELDAETRRRVQKELGVPGSGNRAQRREAKNRKR